MNKNYFLKIFVFLIKSELKVTLKNLTLYIL